jgi:hypothetical protein
VRSEPELLEARVEPFTVEFVITLLRETRPRRVLVRSFTPKLLVKHPARTEGREADSDCFALDDQPRHTVGVSPKLRRFKTPARLTNHREEFKSIPVNKHQGIIGLRLDHVSDLPD